MEPIIFGVATCIIILCVVHFVGKYGDKQHTELRNVVETQARLYTLYAGIETMKAANSERVLNGESPAYSHKAFATIADQLRAIEMKLTDKQT